MLTLSFDFEPRLADKRKYVIQSLDRKDFCPLVIGANDLCKSKDHKHYCATRTGFDSASDYVAEERSKGHEVKSMDRVY